MLTGLEKIIELLAHVAVEQHMEELQSPKQPNPKENCGEVKREINREKK